MNVRERVYVDMWRQLFMMDTGIKVERHMSQRNVAFHGAAWIILYICKSGCIEV